MELTGPLAEAIIERGYATSGEVAELCNRDRSRVRSWLMSGQLAGKRVKLPETKTAEWHISVEALRRFDVDAVTRRVHAPKLTPQKVREIRKLHGKLTNAELALQFGISQSMVSRIISGERWAHV